jgi:ankyrin repeat protein
MEDIKEIIKSRDLTKVKAYFDKGHDINKQNSSGETALIMACEFQCLEIVEYLLSLGANTALKESGGYDAEAVAFWHGEVRMGCYSKQCKAIVAALKATHAST